MVATRVSPSFRVFWLHARAEQWLDDMEASGRQASAQDVGFAASAVAVATVDPDRVGVAVETWSKKPLLLGDEESFEYAVEGEIDVTTGQWCIDESQDWQIQNGTLLQGGAGRYGVRVTAYHQPDEHYRLQLWPVGRRR
jgi:hypothetical protein